eukprot:gene10694-biopygen7788
MAAACPQVCKVCHAPRARRAAAGCGGEGPLEHGLVCTAMHVRRREWVGQEIRCNCDVLCGEDGSRRPLHWWRYSCESYKKLA